MKKLTNNSETLIIFDTNAYWNFVHRRNFNIENIQQDIFRLKLKEEQSNCRPVISEVVLAELLKHLQSPSDPDYVTCKHAIAAAIGHCKTNEGRVKFIPSYDNIILEEAEKQGLQHMNLEVKKAIYLHAVSIIDVSNKIEQNLSDEFISSKEIYDAVKINVINESRNRESFYNTFLAKLQTIDEEFDATDENIQAVLFRGDDKKKQSKEYRRILEEEMFKKAVIVSILSSEIKNELLSTEFINYFVEKYQPIIFLMKTLYEKFEGMGKIPKNFWEKDMNTFNDIIIIMGALYEENSILVTKDAQIIKAYKDSGLEHRVMDFDEYEKEMLS